jgi:hypothetical protein
MASMVSEFRKHAAWSAKPPGFDGALILAAASPEAGAVLGGCIRTVVPGRLPPWLNVLVKDAAWFKVADKR